MITKTIYSDLVALVGEHNVKIDEPLKNHTYTKIGGNADFLIFPTSYAEIQAAVQYARQQQLPVTILGNGSNVIIRDNGIRGIVINLTKLTSIVVNETKIIAQSGAAIIETSRAALFHALTGLEFACGIPGTVGGAVFMNAGAYGGEVSHVLEEALLLNLEGEVFSLTARELELEYRSSVIAKKGLIVLEATFSLLPGNAEDIKAKMDDLTFQRESKQPLEFPSCGSVFKRPPNMFAGKLIQDSGLQGTKIGGAQVSLKHAGFIVNVNHSTAEDYIGLIQHVRQTVKEKFNVELEPEVKIIGE